MRKTSEKKRKKEKEKTNKERKNTLLLLVVFRIRNCVRDGGEEEGVSERKINKK